MAGKRGAGPSEPDTDPAGDPGPTSGAVRE
jgi:hypothetical protein